MTSNLNNLLITDRLNLIVLYVCKIILLYKYLLQYILLLHYINYIFNIFDYHNSILLYQFYIYNFLCYKLIKNKSSHLYLLYNIFRINTKVFVSLTMIICVGLS